MANHLSVPTKTFELSFKTDKGIFRYSFSMPIAHQKQRWQDFALRYMSGVSAAFWQAYQKAKGDRDAKSNV